MKTATLLTEVAGRKPGSVATVNHEGDTTYLLEDAGGQFSAPKSSVEVKYPSEQADPVAGVPALTIDPIRDIEKVEQGDAPYRFVLTDGYGLQETVCIDELKIRHQNKNYEIEGFSVADAILRIQNFQMAQKPVPQPVVIVPRLEVDEPIEKAARLMYDRYNEAVGGVAWNGDALPTADEFFEDPTKQKQANAWREVAGGSFEILYAVGVLEAGKGEGEQEDPKTEEVSDIGGSPASNPDDYKQHVEANLEESKATTEESGNTEGEAPNNGVDDSGEEE